MGVLGRFIFWDFPRGSWQYDVMVGLIVAFIFVTPMVAPDFFHDQPKAASVQMTEDNQFWLSPELLSGLPVSQRLDRAKQIVKDRYKTHRPVTRIIELTNDEHEVLGYLASTQP
jgi:hypothetical protein